MQLKATREMEQVEFEAFFEGSMPQLEETDMKKHGYFLYTEEKPTAFFSLVPVDQEVYWLRTLMIKRIAPVLMPVTIIQTAESLSKGYGARSLIIHSKTATLDELLTQLGYRPTDQVLETSLQASWWITALENVDEIRCYTH